MQSAVHKTATWHGEDQLPQVPGKSAFELHFCETNAFLMMFVAEFACFFTFLISETFVRPFKYGRFL